jgi:hypothetical protein
MPFPLPTDEERKELATSCLPSNRELLHSWTRLSVLIDRVRVASHCRNLTNFQLRLLGLFAVSGFGNSRSKAFRYSSHFPMDLRSAITSLLVSTSMRYRSVSTMFISDSGNLLAFV